MCVVVSLCLPVCSFVSLSVCLSLSPPVSLPVWVSCVPGERVSVGSGEGAVVTLLWLRQRSIAAQRGSALTPEAGTDSAFTDWSMCRGQSWRRELCSGSPPGESCMAPPSWSRVWAALDHTDPCWLLQLLDELVLLCLAGQKLVKLHLQSCYQSVPLRPPFVHQLLLLHQLGRQRILAGMRSNAEKEDFYLVSWMQVILNTLLLFILPDAKNLLLLPTVTFKVKSHGDLGVSCVMLYNVS